MKNLKEHAVSIFEMAIQFLEYVLDGFPEDKLEEPLGKASPPLYWMKHIAGTASFWMRKIDREFKHKMRVVDKQSFFEKLNLQLTELKEILEDDSEVYWIPSTKSQNFSVPWAMIRSANHAMHHASMLIVYRHYYGLEPLQQSNEINWRTIVDLPGNINYLE
ncbi:MAG: hypothetical protein ACW98K_00225 [Candidatus Kariarchaeaceae archaeon]|jgi:hypothetical protein